MLYHISKLSQDDQELVKKAPLLVSILVAGSDGEIEKEEIERAVSLIHTKSFSEASDIRHLYKEIDHDVESTLNLIIGSLPTDAAEREKVFSDELAGLNTIFAKLDAQIATDFYNSLRKFAVSVAQVSGGILGMGSINYQEKEMVKLPMLTAPGSH